MSNRISELLETIYYGLQTFIMFVLLFVLAEQWLDSSSNMWHNVITFISMLVITLGLAFLTLFSLGVFAVRISKEIQLWQGQKRN